MSNEEIFMKETMRDVKRGLKTVKKFKWVFWRVIEV